MEVRVSDDSTTAEDLKSKDTGDEDRSDESTTADDPKSKDAGDEDESDDPSAELMVGRPEVIFQLTINWRTSTRILPSAPQKGSWPT